MLHIGGSCSRAGVRRPAGWRDQRTDAPDRQADEALVRRFAAGEPDAVRQVLAAYGGPMLTAALGLLGGYRRLADEAVQAAMLKAWRAARTFDSTRPLAPWLYTIVRRCAIDLWRQERRHQLAPRSTVDEGAATTADSADTAATTWIVRRALDTLPLNEHAVLRLVYFDGLTHGEVAARLSIPIGTVKSRASRAQQRLRAELAPQLALAS